MNRSEFLDKYKDIVLLPLVLDVPPFDLQKLYTWLDNNLDFEYLYHCAKNGNDISKDDYYKAKYASNHNAFFRNYFVRDYKLGWWNQNFNETFPEIIEWFDKELPIPIGAKGKRFTFYILKQHSIAELESHNKPLCSRIHTDENDLGLRWFINNKNNNVYFYKTRKPVLELRQEWDGQGDLYNKLTDDNDLIIDHSRGIPMSNENCIGTPIRINLNENTSWLMNQRQSAHAVSHELDNSDKITLIVQSYGVEEYRWDWTKLDEILSDSLIKNRQQGIFYDDFLV